jgi:hypothetical protein
MAIHLRDAHVSRNFMDTMEEEEPWTPYVDPKFPAKTASAVPLAPTPIHSVTTFQQLCLLSRIMTKIINRFYVVGATAANARASLQSIDDALIAWKESLPVGLTFEPWSEHPIPSRQPPAPNLMILNGLYYSLVILLHRPFIADGHLRSAAAPASSWKRCSTAARNITSIALSYQSTYTLRGAPYLLSYAVYVACTIHVRNAAAAEGSQGGEYSSLLAASLKCLDELSLPNAGASKPASIIRKLVVSNGLRLAPGKMTLVSSPHPTTTACHRTKGFLPEPPADIQSPSSLDLDTILRMFPSRSPATGQLLHPENFDQRFGTDYYAPEDLLYGFMDGESTSFPDFPNGVFRI